VYWVQHNNVSLYPTVYPQQLFMPPWSEYAMAQLFALAQGDRFINVVQWFSLVGCGIGVSLLARSFGATALGQALAATIAMTIPQGIMQASGAKNDFVTAFWSVCCLYFLTAFKQRPQRTQVVLAALSCGLTLMTKSTGYFVLPPIMLGIWLFWPQKTRRAFTSHLPLFAVLVVLVNAPHYVRTYTYAKSPFGCDSADCKGGWKYANDRITFSGIVSNLVRNTAIHLATPSAEWNADVQRYSEKLVKAFGGDPKDPATTWPGASFQITQLSLNEDSTGNLIHLLLIAATITVIAARKQIRTPEMIVFALGLAAGYLLFCTYLRWQPWHMRLHLPFFVLWSALIGAIVGRWAVATALCGATLLLFASPALLEHERRPLISSSNIFNSTRQQLLFTYKGYTSAAMLADGMSCQNIGIDANYGFLEYPLLSAVHAGIGRRRVEHLSVADKSVAYKDPDFKPGCVVCVGCAPHSVRWNQYAVAGMSGVLLDEVSFFYPSSARFPKELYALVPPPGPRILGDNGGWITSDGFDIAVPGDLLREKPTIEATGQTFLTEYLGKGMTVRAEQRTPEGPAKVVPAQLDLPSGKGMVSYRIVVQTDPRDHPADRDVVIHLSFNKYVVPKEIGYTPDPRKLVIVTPRQIVLRK
jgi:hypothetical protein